MCTLAIQYLLYIILIFVYCMKCLCWKHHHHGHVCSRTSSQTWMLKAIISSENNEQHNLNIVNRIYYVNRVHNLLYYMSDCIAETGLHIVVVMLLLLGLYSTPVGPCQCVD